MRLIMLTIAFTLHAIITATASPVYLACEGRSSMIGVPEFSNDPVEQSFVLDLDARTVIVGRDTLKIASVEETAVTAFRVERKRNGEVTLLTVYIDRVSGSLRQQYWQTGEPSKALYDPPFDGLDINYKPIMDSKLECRVMDRKF